MASELGVQRLQGFFGGETGTHTHTHRHTRSLMRVSMFPQTSAHTPILLYMSVFHYTYIYIRAGQRLVGGAEVQLCTTSAHLCNLCNPAREHRSRPLERSDKAASRRRSLREPSGDPDRVASRSAT